MNSKLLGLILLFTASLVPSPAAEDPRLAAVRAADDERAAATIAADKARLGAIFSDELRYSHSTGAVDTKASYSDTLVSGRTKYLLIDYQERNFTFPAPGIALMTGRAHIKSSSATATNDNILGFLAVWREEKGHWRFLAWQSCKIPPPTSAAK